MKCQKGLRSVFILVVVVDPCMLNMKTVVKFMLSLLASA